jgi:hypothetical protein
MDRLREMVAFDHGLFPNMQVDNPTIDDPTWKKKKGGVGPEVGSGLI